MRWSFHSTARNSPDGIPLYMFMNCSFWSQYSLIGFAFPSIRQSPSSRPRVLSTLATRPPPSSMRLPLPGDCWCPPLCLFATPCMFPPFPTRTRLDPPINCFPLRRLRPPSPASRPSLCFRCWPICSPPQSGVVRSMGFSFATDHIEHPDVSRSVLTTVDNRMQFYHCREEPSEGRRRGGEESGKGERRGERRVNVDSPGSSHSISRPPPSLSIIGSHRTCVALSVNLLLLFGPLIEISTQPRSSRKSGSQFLASKNLRSWHKIMSREVALLSSNAPLLPLRQNPGLVRIDHGLETKRRRDHIGQCPQLYQQKKTEWKMH